MLIISNFPFIAQEGQISNEKYNHVSVNVDIKPGYSNSLGSASIGMRPSLWERTSSCTSDVLFAMYTLSIAMVGT